MLPTIKTCTGFGHREIYKDITNEMYQAVTAAIELGCEEFLCGGYGAFDRQFAACVYRAKQKFPHKNIATAFAVAISLSKNSFFDKLAEVERVS